MPRLPHEQPFGLVGRHVARNRSGLSAHGTLSAVLIERRPLARLRLVRWLQAGSHSLRITSVAAIDELTGDETLAQRVNLIILSIGDAPIRNRDGFEDIERLTRRNYDVPIVLLSEYDELKGIAEIIQRGVRGYILTTLDQAEVAEALRFIVAGGTFVPAVAVVRWMVRQAAERSKQTQTALFDRLTPREAEVLIHLSQGKPNKIIAFELNISESTVKVFVRRILAKLSANNRTEVAYLARTQIEALGREAFPSENLPI